MSIFDKLLGLSLTCIYSFLNYQYLCLITKSSIRLCTTQQYVPNVSKWKLLCFGGEMGFKTRTVKYLSQFHILWPNRLEAYFVKRQWTWNPCPVSVEAMFKLLRMKFHPRPGNTCWCDYISGPGIGWSRVEITYTSRLDGRCGLYIKIWLGQFFQLHSLCTLEERVPYVLLESASSHFEFTWDSFE